MKCQRIFSHNFLYLSFSTKGNVPKIVSNPIKGLKNLPELKKESRPISVQEAKQILEHSNEFWRRIWYAYFATGLRKMELANLLFTDNDWGAREIVVRGTCPKAAGKDEFQSMISCTKFFCTSSERHQIGRQGAGPIRKLPTELRNDFHQTMFLSRRPIRH